MESENRIEPVDYASMLGGAGFTKRIVGNGGVTGPIVGFFVVVAPTSITGEFDLDETEKPAEADNGPNYGENLPVGAYIFCRGKNMVQTGGDIVWYLK